MAKSSDEDRDIPHFKKTANESFSKKTPPEEAEANEYIFFGLAHIQVVPVGFKIIFAAGNIAAIHYHDLVSPMTFDGAGVIELRTSLVHIKIKGKNLKTLFDYFIETRIIWIKEPDSSFVQLPKDQPEIESIKIEHKD